MSPSSDPRCGSMVERPPRDVYNHFTMTGNAALILWPMLAHIGLVFFLYAWLTAVRVGAVRRGEVEYSCFVFGKGEPPQAARISQNLKNQFELPVIFYATVVLLIVLGRVTAIDVIAAWVFVGGRLIHS